MGNILKQMVEQHKTATLPEKKTAMKEIIQETALCGLAQTDFFEYVVLHGGSSIRIFYDSNRFSEDLDFNLIGKNPGSFSYNFPKS